MSRGGKSKNAYLPGDLVALGSKNSRVEPNPQEKRGGNILLHRKLMESTLCGKFIIVLNCNLGTSDFFFKLYYFF